MNVMIMNFAISKHKSGEAQKFEKHETLVIFRPYFVLNQ